MFELRIYVCTCVWVTFPPNKVRLLLRLQVHVIWTPGKCFHRTEGTEPPRTLTFFESTFLKVIRAHPPSPGCQTTGEVSFDKRGSSNKKFDNFKKTKLGLKKNICRRSGVVFESGLPTHMQNQAGCDATRNTHNASWCTLATAESKEEERDLFFLLLFLFFLWLSHPCQAEGGAAAAARGTTWK